MPFRDFIPRTTSNPFVILLVPDRATLVAPLVQRLAR